MRWGLYDPRDSMTYTPLYGHHVPTLGTPCPHPRDTVTLRWGHSGNTLGTQWLTNSYRTLIQLLTTLINS